MPGDETEFRFAHPAWQQLEGAASYCPLRVQDLTEKLPGPLVLWGCEELLWRGDFNDLAGIHEDHPVGDVAGEAHSCVTRTMVMPLSASSTITSSTSLTISGSSAEVGS